MAAAAATLALSWAGSACAGAISCIWNRLPAENRTRILADYNKSAALAADNLEARFGEIGETTMGLAILSCDIPANKAEAAGEGLAYYIMELGSVRMLETSRATTGERLLAAWGALSDKQRTALQKWVTDLDGKGKTKDAETNALLAYAAEAGLPLNAETLQGPAFEQLISFLVGHANRQRVEDSL